MYTLKNQVYSRSQQQNHNGTTSSQNRNAINGVDCVEGKIVYSLNGSLDLDKYNHEIFLLSLFKTYTFPIIEFDHDHLLSRNLDCPS